MDQIDLIDGQITCVADCEKGTTEALLRRGTRIRIIVSGVAEAILDETLDCDCHVKLGAEIHHLTGEHV